MTALPRRRRNRTWAMLVTTLVVAASIPVLGYVGAKAIFDSRGGRDAGADELPVERFPTTPVGLYLTHDDAGALSSVAVFVLSPAGIGGSIVSVPVNADVGLAASARQSLQQVYAEGGLEATQAAVESLLLVGVDVAADSDPAQAAVFLSQFEPITVTLTSEVPAASESDTPLSPGSAVLQATTAARVLTAGATDPQQATRQGNLDAVWAGVAQAVGPGRTVATPSSTVPASFDELTTRLFGAQTQSRGLTASALTGAENPTNVDAVQLDRSEAVLVFASIAPGSLSAPAQGPRIRLEAPPGYDEQIKQTIDQLLFLHANVVSGAQVASTDEVFGQITFGTPTVRIDGVDVTVQLGTDYLDGLTP
ncbi:MAG: hypothetical protein HZB15_10710 [Actinobacteria bacterium]|nr:hypothetical protein [Actinomycetota bacterium]